MQTLLTPFHPLLCVQVLLQLPYFLGDIAAITPGPVCRELCAVAAARNR